MPRSEKSFHRKLKEEPAYCAFMTCAALAYCSACCDGSMPNAIAGMIFGDGHFQRMARQHGTDHIVDWPYIYHGKTTYPMRHWAAVVEWLRCIDAGSPCYQCEPAMEQAIHDTRQYHDNP